MILDVLESRNNILYGTFEIFEKYCFLVKCEPIYGRRRLCKNGLRPIIKMDLVSQVLYQDTQLRYPISVSNLVNSSYLVLSCRTTFYYTIGFILSLANFLSSWMTINFSMSKRFQAMSSSRPDRSGQHPLLIWLEFHLHLKSLSRIEGQCLNVHVDKV